MPEAELARRREAWRPPGGEWPRRYFRRCVGHVLQAERGADFDFLVGASGDPVQRDEH